jgi:ketosteroid isomerase-like protein
VKQSCVSSSSFAKRGTPILAELVSDFIDVGDRVAVRLRWRTAGRGPEANMEWTVIHTVRKDKVIGIEYFWDHAEALEVLGLSEQDAPH